MTERQAWNSHTAQLNEEYDKEEAEYSTAGYRSHVYGTGTGYAGINYGGESVSGGWNPHTAQLEQEYDEEYIEEDLPADQEQSITTPIQQYPSHATTSYVEEPTASSSAGNPISAPKHRDKKSKKENSTGSKIVNFSKVPQFKNDIDELFSMPTNSKDERKAKRTRRREIFDTYKDRGLTENIINKHLAKRTSK